MSFNNLTSIIIPMNDDLLILTTFYFFCYKYNIANTIKHR